MTIPFRYDDEARRLEESLAEIALTEPPPKVASEGIQRIAEGKTALASLDADRKAAAPAAQSELQKDEVRRRLQALLAHKGVKAAARDQFLDRFSASVEKIAGPTGPDVSPSAMTSGTGRLEDYGDKPKTRFEGFHQGPAANLIARGLKDARAKEKQAASRLDREVLRGTVSYADATPGGSAFAHLPPHQQQGMARRAVHAPAEVSPGQVARKQNLRGAVFRNHMALGEKHRAQGLDSTEARTFGKEAPAATTGMYTRKGDRVDVGTQGPGHHGHSTLQHELGERVDNNRLDRSRYDHASHAGVTPILMENHAAAGDPSELSRLQRMRASNHDDIHVSRLAKGVGHHPDSPLPVGGRHQRALERRLAESSHMLSPRTLKDNITRQMLLSEGLKPGEAPVTIKTLSARGTQAIRGFKRSKAEKALRALSATVR